MNRGVARGEMAAADSICLLQRAAFADWIRIREKNDGILMLKSSTEKQRSRRPWSIAGEETRAGFQRLEQTMSHLPHKTAALIIAEHGAGDPACLSIVWNTHEAHAV